MSLTRIRRRELREMGWSLRRRQAERPAAVPAADVLHVGEDVTVEAPARLLATLDDRR